ncbi:MAG: FAD-dependent oxidoreductase [Thermoplasmata archaeon]|nr:MAG: FAD-dependent oxidoreductase [Thermoplasmata archaeon]
MNNKTKKVGSVLVVGGGIGGMQSALDLAEAGFRVYLLERTPSIGGTMAQLDKTFPTNDCAMCILAPKLVYTGRHENIEIITNAEITDIAGEAGNFHVMIKKHPRFVDIDKCNSCGDCTEHCPVSLVSDFEEGLALRKAIYQQFPQAIPNIFNIVKNEGVSPCELACPAGLNAQAFVALASQEKFAEAYDLIREIIPLPGSLGRICYHPCESDCNRKDIDEPISICRIRRFISDYIYDHPKVRTDYHKYRNEKLREKEVVKVEIKRGKNRKVAIVGAGPAGLTAASDLAGIGYQPTIFEAEKHNGGMLYYGIPEHRLPKEYLRKEINLLCKENKIDIKNNIRFGKDFNIDDLRKQGFKAIFIAIGAHKSRLIHVDCFEGAESRILQGVEYLKKLNSGKIPQDYFKGKKILVIGGGNVAMDSARSAKRLGGDVTIVYRRSLKEMPAHKEEIQQAKEEGITFKFLTNPQQLLRRGKDTCLQCVKMKLGTPDESGRRKPLVIKDSEFDINCDYVIFAIGQEVDVSSLKKNKIKLNKSELIEVDPVTLQTSQKDVFAGGDAVSGPASAVEAIAAGHDAAISIDRYLNKEDMRKGRGEKECKKAEIPPEAPRFQLKRESPSYLPIKQRMKSFNEVDQGISKDRVVREAQRCLNCEGCCECLQCVLHCESDAIDQSMKETTETLDVGAIIVASGFDLFDPSQKEEYGHGKYENVVTSKELERYLSASGPTAGHVIRRSDSKEPKNIAFIQCVGSRDENSNEYCSSVCCMYAIKQAIIAQEHTSGLKTHLFFMDIRAFGKEFDDYYIRAEKEHGVNFTRCRIPSIEEDPETKDLIITYLENEERKQKVFDMVVLSCALEPLKSSKELSDKLGIDLNEYGFFKTNLFSPLETSKPGIYVTGTSSGPKDIPMTVTDASGAAAKASCIISSERHSLETFKEYPPERDTASEVPRIGVFVCRCGINIGAYVDVSSVVKYAKTLPNVVHTEEFIHSCSHDTQIRIIDIIKKHKLNRVVVSACTPRTHEQLFQSTLREAGLNPHLFEMTNIREQCSWVHMKEPEKATEKAKDLIKMAVSKAQLDQPLTREKLPVIPKGLVIGGGLSGMTAALELAEQGFETYLIERENDLGGSLRKTYFLLGNEDPQELLQSLKKKVNNNKRIRVFTNAEIKDVHGHIGDFTTRISIDGKEEKELKHGIIIVATGAKEYEPIEYLYGHDDRVLTKWELEEKLVKGGFSAKNVVMIQCVGCRNEERTYCSRVCCGDAIKNALKIKEISPETNIYILYKDIRTYGFREKYYKEAAEKGVLFIRYDDETKPIVTNKDGLKVSIMEPILRSLIILKPDMIVLSNAMLPQDGAKALSQILKVHTTKDGFFLEAHMKLRPVDFVRDGVFLCGKAHSPKYIEECIVQASAAAARAITILSKDKIESEAVVSVVIEDLCSGCGFCIEACPYLAIELKDGKAQVDAASCKGCGSCASTCPSGAIEQKGFKKEQIISMIDAAAK